MSLLKMKTGYRDTISWSVALFERQIVRGDYSIIEVYDKNTDEYLGSVSVDEVRRHHRHTFTRGGRGRRVIVAGFNRGV